MNTKQRATWEELVRQCESRFYSSINVASRVRSDAIVAAGKLAELVTPEMVTLLERAGSITSGPKRWTSIGHFASQDGDRCLALAARIREVLTLEEHK